jgi:DNA mismatch repair ATPase MutL
MDGLFSPHGLEMMKSDQFWCGEFLVRQENEKWIAIHAGKLVSIFVQEKLTRQYSSIPLMVSEPYPAKGISEKTMASLNEKGFEFEYLGADTIVMRAIPEWMNGLPLREIVEALLTNKDVSGISIRPSDWSTSGWDEMIETLGTSRLFELNIMCDLRDVLREKLK